MMNQTLSPEDARARLIKRSDMVACKLAFIDCKMPGSERKENYSLVGPGVTQSADQVVNLTEAHGFSLGVAAMPPATVNNLHIHFTAEVFMIQRGTWTFRWGADGKDGEIVGHPGDVVSIPTWIFRGFTNTGDVDGWIFTALGADDTGGIIWHPSILSTAAQHGMFLTRENMLVDTDQGAARPAPDALMPPLTPEQIATLPHYGVDEMVRRVVPADARDWVVLRAAGFVPARARQRGGAGDRPWHDAGPRACRAHRQPARLLHRMAPPAAGQPGRPAHAGGEAGS